jgi:hypothetical protein
MSVPHDGSDIAVFANRIANIARAVTHLNTTNIRDLECDSRPLQDISKAFGNLEGFSITTVIESDETLIPGTGKYVLVGIPLRISHLSPLTDFESSICYISKDKPW